jgi:hypothetical protein
MTGTVEFVHLAEESGADPEPRETAEAVSGKGLRGDRYFENEGTFSTPDEETKRDVTLIEAEALEQAEADYGVAVRPRRPPPQRHRSWHRSEQPRRNAVPRRRRRTGG